MIVWSAISQLISNKPFIDCFAACYRGNSKHAKVTVKHIFELPCEDALICMILVTGAFTTLQLLTSVKYLGLGAVMVSLSLLGYLFDVIVQNDILSNLNILLLYIIVPIITWTIIPHHRAAMIHTQMFHIIPFVLTGCSRSAMIVAIVVLAIVNLCSRQISETVYQIDFVFQTISGVIVGLSLHNILYYIAAEIVSQTHKPIMAILSMTELRNLETKAIETYETEIAEMMTLHPSDYLEPRSQCVQASSDSLDDTLLNFKGWNIEDFDDSDTLKILQGAVKDPRERRILYDGMYRKAVGIFNKQSATNSVTQKQVIGMSTSFSQKFDGTSGFSFSQLSSITRTENTGKSHDKDTPCQHGDSSDRVYCPTENTESASLSASLSDTYKHEFDNSTRLSSVYDIIERELALRRCPCLFLHYFGQPTSYLITANEHDKKRALKDSIRVSYSPVDWVIYMGGMQYPKLRPTRSPLGNFNDVKIERWYQIWLHDTYSRILISSRYPIIVIEGIWVFQTLKIASLVEHITNWHKYGLNATIAILLLSRVLCGLLLILYARKLLAVHDGIVTGVLHHSRLYAGLQLLLTILTTVGVVLGGIAHEVRPDVIFMMFLYRMLTIPFIVIVSRLSWIVYTFLVLILHLAVLGSGTGHVVVTPSAAYILFVYFLISNVLLVKPLDTAMRNLFTGAALPYMLQLDLLQPYEQVSG